MRKMSKEDGVFFFLKLVNLSFISTTEKEKEYQVLRGTKVAELPQERLASVLSPWLIAYFTLANYAFVR